LHYHAKRFERIDLEHMVAIKAQVSSLVDVDVNHPDVVDGYRTAPLVERLQLLNALLMDIDDEDLQAVVRFCGDSTEFIDRLESFVERWRKLSAA